MKIKRLLFLSICWMIPLSLKAQPCALNVASGTVTLSNTAVTYCSVVVSAGATLVIGGSVTMNVTGNVDIEGTVDGVGNGYGSAFVTALGPGAGEMGTSNSAGGGGGGHGGAGGNGGEGDIVGGSANDTPGDPVLMGSAGGGVSFSAWAPPTSPVPGGAAFLLSASSGTVSINGTIDMSGGSSNGGGGAGGTISIRAQTILLNGALNANGGAGASGGCGGGGGGILLVCPSVNPLSGTGTTSVSGGAGGPAAVIGLVAYLNGAPGGGGFYTLCGPPNPTPTSTVTPTLTTTPTPYPNIFYVSLNAFTPAQGPVSLFVETNNFPGAYSLNVFNSVGEHIKTLDSKTLSGPLSQSYSWDGTNKYKATCASGVYIFDLIEPLSHQQKRVLFIR